MSRVRRGEVSEGALLPIEPQAQPQTAQEAGTIAPTSLIPATELLVDLRRARSDAGDRFLYWLGALPSLPFEHVHVAGETFSKRTERVIPGPNGTVRVPCSGQVVPLTRQKLELIGKRLKQMLVRVDVEHVSDGTFRSGRSAIITIPTQEQLDEVRANLPEGSYHPLLRQPRLHGNCQPLAAHIWCVPHRGPYAEQLQGTPLPQPLSETGLVLPGPDHEPYTG